MVFLNLPGTVPHIRKTKAGIELATVRLENPKGDRSVTVIGVQHIATQASWDRDIAHLRELEAAGAKIFLEGVLPVEGELSAEDGERVAALQGTMGTQKFLADVTGLTHQKAAFTAAGTTWKPYDIPMLELVRELKDSTIRRLQKAAKLDEEDLKAAPELALGLLRLLPFIPTMLSRILSGDLTKNIIDRRNEYAVDGVLRTTTDHRVLYWGAAHLSGMVKLLRQQGYTVTSEEWRVVLPASYKVPKTIDAEDEVLASAEEIA